MEKIPQVVTNCLQEIKLMKADRSVHDKIVQQVLDGWAIVEINELLLELYKQGVKDGTRPNT